MKVINIDAAIAQLRTVRDAAVEERNSALYAAGRFDLGKD
jgi:hypothetical protein